MDILHIVIDKIVNIDYKTGFKIGMGWYQIFKIDTGRIRYQWFLVVSIPDFDTSKFKPCSTVLLWHSISAKMVLDDCGKLYPEHNWWFYLHPIPSDILPEKNLHF